MREKFASSTFNDFSGVKELYRSSAGAVYLGKFKYDNKDYVLKERKIPELGKTKDIMSEAKLLVQLSHPNVIRCDGWFKDEKRNSVFIILEYCGGGDLSKAISYRKSIRTLFDEKEVWFIFSQICRGVKHLHENGIIHRDLKAMNIMCSTNGRVFKVGDLGVSRQVSENTLMLKTFYGTPLYLSPELVENKPYNEKTDIWSLGVMLYELVTLHPPFKASTLLSLAKLVLKGSYDPIPNHYSHSMDRCIAWLLNLDFKKRPNIAQLIDFVDSKLTAGYWGQGLSISSDIHNDVVDSGGKEDFDTDSLGTVENDDVPSKGNLKDINHNGNKLDDKVLILPISPARLDDHRVSLPKHGSGSSDIQKEPDPAPIYRYPAVSEVTNPSPPRSPHRRRKPPNEEQPSQSSLPVTNKVEKEEPQEDIAVDIQRITSLLRREAVHYRKLLQMRDFLGGGGEALLQKMRASQAKTAGLQEAGGTGKMRWEIAVR